jgi:AcrR family transcriptional regulator
MTARRDDARRNRETILRVADDAFAHSAEAVPLHEIARRAGLGRATVYRHFPDRQALAAAVAAQQLDQLRRATSVPGGCAFRDLLHAVLSTQVTMRPLVALLRELPPREQRRNADAVIGALTPAFRRAQADEGLRADLEPSDLVTLLAMLDAGLEQLPDRPDRDAAAGRLVELLLDGLFAGR